MRRVGSALLVILFLFVELAPVMSAQAEGQGAAPEFTLTDIDGKEFSLADFRGTTVVVTFAATKLITCKFQVNVLVTVSKHVTGDYAAILIGVSNSTVRVGGDTNEQLRRFSEECNFTGIVARDTKGVAENYNVVYIPTTFIIDQGGYIRHKHLGVASTREQVLIEELTVIIPEFSSATVMLIIMILATAGIAIGVRQRSGSMIAAGEKQVKNTK